MAQYDLIVIGGGPAGYLGAERAAHAGLKTFLRITDHAAVWRNGIGIGNEFIQILVEDRDADACDLIEIPEQSAQFFQVESGNHNGASPRF